MTHNPQTCNACGKVSRRKTRINDDCRFCRGLSCSECCKLAREVVWALYMLEGVGGSGTMTMMSADCPGSQDMRRWPDGAAIRECVKLGLMTLLQRGGIRMYTLTDAGRKFLSENPL